MTIYRLKKITTAALIGFAVVFAAYASVIH